ncbi:FAD-binding oxidoreductase [Streptomyces sp. LHD-70]|uniref:NAD(P)/FAD-dependent oxidoreductase n=1 Tax=Streptomyces sp. LHD-70 TaxID=3072140 RepID=UPI00280DF5A8|nr:FAD-binding oxidoreductase [Streptomyces sp. LHD-70]MDQ8708112.1 FAD-binding oxidoreductase [Streptomyces sp. LHD-70]
MSLPSTADVVVVGSGITGAATAAAVAARGASVVLLDKESGPAREGSGRAQGSLRVQGRHGAEFPLAQEALRLWTEASEEGDFELVTGGNLYFRTSDEELPVLRHLVEEAHQAGLTTVELLDADQTREIMPCATGPFLGAMWSPVDAHCQPEKGTEHYARRAGRAGAHIAYGVKVTQLLEAGGRITGVHTTHGTIQTGAVVVAAGVWTPYLARTVGVKVPIMPVIMSELETEPVKPLFTQTIRAFGFGARQRPGGQVVVSAGLNAKVMHDVSLADCNGLRYWLPRAMSFRKNLKLNLDTRRVLEQLRHRATLDTRLVPHTSPEPAVDRPLVDSSLDRLARVIPELRGASVCRYWGGLVDMTPDGLPVIDSGSGPSGLTVITGLSGHGFTLGPALGEIAADLSLTGTTSRAIDTFRLSRFADGPVDRPEMMI